MVRLEGFTKPVQVDGNEYICLLWDTIGSNDFEKLRPLSYPKVILMFVKIIYIHLTLTLKVSRIPISCMYHAYPY